MKNNILGKCQKNQKYTNQRWRIPLTLEYWLKNLTEFYFRKIRAWGRWDPIRYSEGYSLNLNQRNLADYQL